MRRQRITITLRGDVIKKIDTLIDNKTIRNRSNAIETILLKEFKNRILKKAVILSAGSTEEIKINGKLIPKVLAPIGGQILIEKNIDWLKNFGVSEIIIAIGKSDEQIREKLGDGKTLGIKITYIRVRGTGEILLKAQDYLTETFFMTNGDILLEGHDIEDMYLFHIKNHAKGTIAVATAVESSQLGSIYMKGDLITGFEEKLRDKKKQSNLINGGMYILEPDVYRLLPKGFSMVEKDLFPKLAEQKKLFGYQIGKNWVHLHDENKYQEYIKNN